MKFLCLGYFDAEKMEARSREEIDALMQECRSPLEKLYETHHVVIGAGLENHGKYVCRVNGQVTVTDGPFIETKEMIGGAFILEADDIDEAVRAASLHPTIQVAQGEQFGWRLEIRPIHSLKNFI